MPETGSRQPVTSADLPSLGGRHIGSGGRWLRRIEKPKDIRKTLSRLWTYVRGERSLIAIFILVMTSAGIALTVPFLIGKAVDALSAQAGGVSFSLLGVVCVGLLCAYLADAVVSMSQAWLMAGASQRIVASLRRSLFAILQKLPTAFFDTHTHGDLMSRLSNDIDNISGTVSQSTAQLISGAITVTGSLIMMIILSPLLTIASLVTVPLVVFLTRTVSRRTQVLFRQQQNTLGRLNGHIEESMTGILVVKAFNHEEETTSQFKDLNDGLKTVGTRAQIWSGFMMPLMNVIGNVGFAAIAGLGGVLAVSHIITIGIIASFLSYSRQFTRPLNEMANVYNTLQTALAGAERVFEIMDEPIEPPDNEDSVSLENPVGRVEFERVCFGYREGVPVLTDVSFEVPAGSSLALVGPTGAGKTTIVNLLTRFYEMNAGSIRIDGRDIRSYTRDSLRRCFGIVLQDTYLFSGTIGENIRYGRPDATDREVEIAASVANADAFIRKLDAGYDTRLTESGSNLSQGQRQLLAIARALLADPSILILDEATSNVDTRTELHIQEALLKLMEDRTSFIIAHRLSTIRYADRIMVIDAGRIVEHGNHGELMAMDGVYRRMYASQYIDGREE